MADFGLSRDPYGRLVLTAADVATNGWGTKTVAGTDKVEISLAVDPALIGGFVLSVGSRVIDASLAGQVRRLGLSLANVS